MGKKDDVLSILMDHSKIIGCLDAKTKSLLDISKEIRDDLKDFKNNGCSVGIELNERIGQLENSRWTYKKTGVLIGGISLVWGVVAYVINLIF